jgi:hypothetical protein
MAFKLRLKNETAGVKGIWSYSLRPPSGEILNFCGCYQSKSIYPPPEGANVLMADCDPEIEEEPEEEPAEEDV